MPELQTPTAPPLPASFPPASFPVLPATAAVAAPTIEDGLIADRMRFWSSFTGMTTVAACSVAVLLVLLAYFLG